jgi:hypothetical protein
MTETSHDERPTLVLGGTGKTGRRVVEGVQRALGRPPFAAYATRTAATGAWTRAANR